jgi:hypothetical protein
VFLIVDSVFLMVNSVFLSDIDSKFGDLQWLTIDTQAVAHSCTGSGSQLTLAVATLHWQWLNCTGSGYTLDTPAVATLAHNNTHWQWLTIDTN